MASKISAVAGASALVIAGVLVPLPALAGSQVPVSLCEASCGADYEVEAAKCGKVDDETERRKCQDNAHDRLAACRDTCPKTDGQPLRAGAR